MATDSVSSIEQAIEDVRQELLQHPLYAQVDRIERLREFMRSHVFAVWDFMSLLKRLQQVVAGCEVPWLPPADTELARFVNEIVLGEECDEDGRGGYVSHFDLYCQAMTEVGADRSPIEFFIQELRAGRNAEEVLVELDIPESTRQFVEHNLHVARDAKPHQVAAAFCYGREDVIPDMFARLVDAMKSEGHQVERFRYYLNRHIELDGEHHGPLAQRLVGQLCGDSRQRREEVIETARAALKARIQLWDGVLAAINSSAGSVVKPG